MLEEYFFFDGECLISLGGHDSFDSAENELELRNEYSFFIATRDEWEKIHSQFRKDLDELPPPPSEIWVDGE